MALLVKLCWAWAISTNQLLLLKRTSWRQKVDFPLHNKLNSKQKIILLLSLETSQICPLSVQIVSVTFCKYRWYILQMQVLRHISHLYSLIKPSLYMHRLIISILQHHQSLTNQICQFCITWEVFSIVCVFLQYMAAAQHEANTLRCQTLWSTHAADDCGGAEWGLGGCRDVQEHQPLAQGCHWSVSGPASGKERGYDEEWKWGWRKGRAADSMVKQWYFVPNCQLNPSSSLWMVSGTFLVFTE